MNKRRMDELVEYLNHATEMYDNGTPIMSDKEWDDLYFELVELERSAGLAREDSPSQSIHFHKVSVLDSVEHNHFMLSLDKTKSLEDIDRFLDVKQSIAMLKMDGLTCSLTYFNGRLISAETRGDGRVGEQVLHNAMVLPSIPRTIPITEGMIVIDGEIISTIQNFDKFATEYKNPRNFAAGSIRLLDSRICAQRGLEFVAWDCVSGMETVPTLSAKLVKLEMMGFQVTPSVAFQPDGINDLQETVDFLVNEAKNCSYPIDGIVFKFNKVEEYNAEGRTDHHFKGGIAYKFYDELYYSNLRDIEWTMGRTSVLTPAAIFDPIDIDGTTVQRANLHNVSVLRTILGEHPFVMQGIKVYKANAIIPQIDSADIWTEDDIYQWGYRMIPLIEECPYCHERVQIFNNNGVEVAKCPNPNCSGKIVNIFDHYCSKKGLDIKGLSKATLEKLLEWGWINEFADLYKLAEHKNTWITYEGFGIKSVEKILAAIEVSRTCQLVDFLAAIGIPQFGKASLKAVCDKYPTYDEFRAAVDNGENFMSIDGIGESMHNELVTFNYTQADAASEYLTFVTAEQAPAQIQSANIKGNIFCITGKLNSYKNRDELKAVIEANGGEVSSSVSSKTTYLINNDSESNTAKNLNAKKLGIPIITEAEFQNFLTN